jgi:hypothetical protein
VRNVLYRGWRWQGRVAESQSGASLGHHCIVFAGGHIWGLSGASLRPHSGGSMGPCIGTVCDQPRASLGHRSGNSLGHRSGAPVCGQSGVGSHSGQCGRTTTGETTTGETTPGGVAGGTMGCSTGGTAIGEGAAGGATAPASLGYESASGRQPLQLEQKGCTGFAHCLYRTIMPLSSVAKAHANLVLFVQPNRWLCKGNPFNSFCMSTQLQTDAFARPW